jgi:hypothetical protein
MHTRKHTIGRNILRLFEIALFFAVSALGYGLLLKASSFNSKSKTRDHAPGIQRSLGSKGIYRELNTVSGNLIFTKERALSRSNSGITHTLAACHALQFPTRKSAIQDHSFRYLDNHPIRTPRPYNLLEQNPVLLV